MASQRHALKESALASGVALLSVVCAIAGIALHVSELADPDPWFATAISLGIAAGALSVDEKRLVKFQPDTGLERRLARTVIAVALIAAVVGLAIGLINDPDTNPIADVAVTLALISLAVAIESHRLARSGGPQLPFKDRADLLSARSSAGLALLLGIAGVATCYAQLPHSEAWLFASVVFGVIAVAFALDEHLELT